MFTLYHYYLCPSSRFVRLILEEYKIKYNVQLENYWRPQNDFLKINPAGHLPVLIDEQNNPIIGANACLEFFKDLNVKPNFSGENFKDKAEIYRLYHWFDTLFRKEVLDPIIYEKVFSRVVENITPDSSNLRAALQNFAFHVNYFNYLLKNQDFLATNNLTYLDFLASANFSILDYLGLLNFQNNEDIREWYFKIKSRPSFRTILSDQIVGLNPDEKYKLIDA